MKEIKNVEKVELSEYGIKVNPYLTYAQIQVIVDKAKKAENWAERQQIIDTLILRFATDISTEDIENHNHDFWLKTGVVDAVSERIRNLYQIEDAIIYEESLMRILIKLAQEMPEFNEKVNEVMKSASSKK